MRIFLKKQSGFTLIELLVVISIIGFLASASMVMLNSARIKARNAKRVAEIKQIQTALEMFFNHYQYYPSSATVAGEAAGSCADTGSDDSIAGNLFQGLRGVM
ncbi:MAG: type II secretion system protein [bacterium]